MAERNCKKCFHYKACREVASHNGYIDISYTESQCKHFIPTADVVEVVRCRDCKHCYHYVTPTLERYECYYYGCSDEVVNYVEPMHYCAYGERREE